MNMNGLIAFVTEEKNLKALDGRRLVRSVEVGAPTNGGEPWTNGGRYRI